jgi:thimet oligopeptidase
MFEIYAKVLGLRFLEVQNADVWAPGVKLYEIREAQDNSFIAHFYTDFVPREGKYNHFAAFPLVAGRMVGGRYNPPVAAIVGNFAPPTDGKPSLFSHDEVETLFHEFGHIMHQTLTKAKYASLAGSSVARDFVEAPSQMLENWTWDKEMLKALSGHFKNSDKKLPDEIIEQLLMSRNFNKGYFFTRQLLFGIFDMTLHTETKPINDPTAIYKSLYKELTGIDPLPNTHFPAGFGHLMGYSAGYYGYLWSLVYADDMFTKFEKDGLLSSKVGERYRKTILERGDTKEAQTLIEEFLGRKPSNKAFFKKLLNSSSAAHVDELLSKALKN